MYRFTGGQPGTQADLRAALARIEAQRADDRGGTAQRNWTVRRRTDGQAVRMVQARPRGRDPRPLDGRQQRSVVGLEALLSEGP
jgi:hypothetical protein